MFRSGKKICIFLFLLISFIRTGPCEAVEQQYKDCKQCHKEKDKGKVVHPAVLMGCTSCHTTPHEKGTAPKFLSAQVPDLCWGCHDKSAFGNQVKHPPVAAGECTSCHDVHSSDNAKLLLFPVPDLCYNCHGNTNFSGASVHMPVKAGMCTSCHNPHSSKRRRLLVSEPPDLCFTCHDKQTYISDSKEKHHAPVYRGLCLQCHSPHATGNDKLLLFAIPDLCFKCHMESDFKGRYRHSPVDGGMCISCHTPHQGDIRKLLVKEPPELCFSCHDNTEFTQYNQHAPVESGLCDICHDPHASANPSQLRLPINSVCLQCHPKAGKLPHATGTFSSGGGHPIEGRNEPRSKSGQLSCISCHNPHSSESKKLFRYKVKKTTDLCKFCHF